MEGKRAVVNGAPRRVALFGGSFDPPHRGHDALVRAALRLLEPERLLVVPALVPLHRRLSGRVGPERRLAWLRALWRDLPEVEVVDWERRPTPTIVTLRRFADRFPGVVPLLLLGADAAAGMEEWVGYPEHRCWCNLALFPRAGGEAAAPPAGWRLCTPEAWQRDPEPSGRVVRLAVRLPAVSATEVRRRARRGDAIDALVPEAIADEIAASYGRVERQQGA